MLAPRQDQQGLDPPGWNSCSNEKQQSSAVQCVITCDNPNVYNDKPEDLQVLFTSVFAILFEFDIMMPFSFYNMPSAQYNIHTHPHNLILLKKTLVINITGIWKGIFIQAFHALHFQVPIYCI